MYKRNLKPAAATCYSESWQLKLPVRSKKTTKPNSRPASIVVCGGLRSNFLGGGSVFNTGYLPAICVTPHDAQVLDSHSQFIETFKVSGDAVSRLTSCQQVNLSLPPRCTHEATKNTIPDSGVQFPGTRASECLCLWLVLSVFCDRLIVTGFLSRSGSR